MSLWVPVNRNFETVLYTAARTIRYVDWDPHDYWGPSVIYWNDATDFTAATANGPWIYAT